MTFSTLLITSSAKLRMSLVAAPYVSFSAGIMHLLFKRREGFLRLIGKPLPESALV
jgi:hypothetical protein